MTNYYVYCHECGFYPSSADGVFVGTETEAQAQNMANVHQKPGHQTILVPESWLRQSGYTDDHFHLAPNV